MKEELDELLRRFEDLQADAAKLKEEILNSNRFREEEKEDMIARLESISRAATANEE